MLVVHGAGACQLRFGTDRTTCLSDLASSGGPDGPVRDPARRLFKCAPRCSRKSLPCRRHGPLSSSHDHGVVGQRGCASCGTARSNRTSSPQRKQELPRYEASLTHVGCELRRASGVRATREPPRLHLDQFPDATQEPRTPWVQPKRITETDGVIASISIQIDPARQPEGILGEKAPSPRTICWLARSNPPLAGTLPRRSFPGCFGLALLRRPGASSRRRPFGLQPKGGHPSLHIRQVQLRAPHLEQPGHILDLTL